MLVRSRMFSLALALVAGSATAAHAQTAAPMKEEKPGLLRRATVTPDSARRIARALVPTGRIESEEIEMEDGKLAYSFDLTIPGKSGVEELLIDARTGALISREHETPEQEAAEARKEAAEARKDAARPARAGKRPAVSKSPSGH